MGSLKERFVRLLEDNRGLVICIFCLPASFLFDVALSCVRYVQRNFFRKSHAEKVRNVQRAVEGWNRLPKANRKLLVTSRPNWLSLSTTFFPKKNHHQIPTGSLADILELDEERRTVKVEPYVTVREITQFLLPKGYMLTVTLEIGDATCGGLALAVGMTTHSHKVGLYQESIESMEVVLADGSVVNARKDNEYADLFNCLPWSHGSLAFLVSVTLQITPAKPYVRVSYEPVRGMKAYCDKIRDLAETGPHFVEMTIFNPDEAVIISGVLVDAPKTSSEKIYRACRWYKPWFYKHVEGFLSSGKGRELIPMEEYLFRHNRAIFWVLEALIPFGNNPFFRFFFGWLCPPKPAFLKLTTTQGIRELTMKKQVFQDVVLPIGSLEQSIELSTELFDTFPLLVYPCRIYNHGLGQLKPPKPDQITPGKDYGMFYDLGIYGVPGKVKRRELYDAVKTMRRLEKFIRDVGGYSFLYADVFMTESELREMFHLGNYEAVRSKYGADGAFPHLYEKIRPEIPVLT